VRKYRLVGKNKEVVGRDGNAEGVSVEQDGLLKSGSAAGAPPIVGSCKKQDTIRL